MLKRLTTKFRFQEGKICVIAILGFLIPLNLSAQESTMDNYNGLWTDGATWSDGTSPGTASLVTDVHIYGNVVSGSDIDFTGGNLFIHDTLTIYGNLTIGDTLDLTIDPAGILIVRGDFTANDTVDVWSSGQMVVTGTFSILGDNDQGSFDNDGVLYIFDITPALKTGIGYGDFTCVNPVDSCSLYDESDLLASPLSSLYLTGSFSIGVSGPSTFCLGDSVVLTVLDTASNYRWFQDAVQIAGATTFSFAAKISGDYHASFILGGDSMVMEKVTVTANLPPVLSVSGLAAAYCEGSESDTLVGGPAGGFFLAGPALTILATGDSAIFDPAVAGAYDVKYYFTDGLGCTDTATVAIVVNPLPLVVFAGLKAAYCENGPQDTLLGTQPGGVFLGNGITDNTDGTALFDPITVGTYDITYYYTDGNACSDTARVATTVFPLPAVSFSGLNPEYCEGTSQDTLIGSQTGGVFLGSGISDNTDGTAFFDPGTPGTYDITYIYTNGNGCSDTAVQSVTVHALPVVDFIGLSAEKCVMDDDDNLLGNQAPFGTFFGGTVADQGNGTGIFTPLVDGVYNIYYAFTDPNGCRDSVVHSVIVHPLPVVTIGTYNTIWDVNDPSFFIAGSPVGGTFTGKGISGISYSPALAGSGLDRVVYAYTDGNSCINYDTIIFEIRDYNFKAGARIIGDIDNYCSPNAFYTTVGATPDGTAGSCWGSGPNNNRWFMFQATTDQVFVQVNTGGFQGTNQNPMMALWTAGGSQLSCARYWDSNYNDIALNYIGLTPGEWYYISVDNYVNRRGTFTLCVNEEVDYDFWEGAKVVPHTANWRSANAAYTTLNATPDRLKGSCWNTAVNSNRWFTFTALTAEATIEVLTGGVEGTMRYSYAALWDAAGTQISCALYTTDYGDIKMGTDALIVGNQYYISVDHNNNNGYDGSFTLAVDDEADYDFKGGAIEIPHTGGWRSAEAVYTTINASADGVIGTCWPTGPTYSRWFKFQATTNEVTAGMFTGGTEGTLQYGLLMLTDALGSELACTSYNSQYSDIKLGYSALIPGEWYYLMVDNHGGSSGYRGTFTMELDNIVDYDFREGAKVIPHTPGWCSADAVYTTTNASPDGNAGSCWPNGPTFNRWFAFTATSTETLVELKTGGDEGTLRYGLIALWDDLGTELACGRYTTDYGDIKMGYIGLVPGNTYYISVDNHNGSTAYNGTFTLCMDDEVDYDYPLGAIELTDLNNWCSSEAAFTTINATGDTLTGSCWATPATYDRWFKFQATTNEVLVRMLTGGTEGTLMYGMVAIWDAAFNEVACNRYTTIYDDVTAGATSLTPGNWYYVSVDNHGGSTAYRGSFGLCITDVVDYDFKEGAYEITDYDGWCSADEAFTTEGATSDRVAGTCWPNGPSYNRWFKFQATGTEVMFNVQTGGDQGTVRHILAAIFDELGNEVSCAQYTYDYSDVSIGSTALTPGEWYYLSVDNYLGTGYRGTFTLCAENQVDYDFKLGAIELSDIDNWCSLQQEYTTLGASPDQVAGSCWPNGPNYNRWFRFQATTTMFRADIKTGGDDGTMRYIMAAIWDTLGNQLSCQNYTSDYSGVGIGATNLTPGAWYYLSVDNHVGTGYRGSFTLCVDDMVGYDFVEAAHVVNNIVDYCSADAEFTTLGASADRAAPSCWQNGPNYNRWFMFQATASGELTISVKTGGTQGTIRYAMVALWDTSLTEVACRGYVSDYGGVEVAASGLIPGEWYYVSVDNSANTSYRGTFTLCMDDAINYDYFAGALVLSDLDGWCSDYSVYSTVSATPDEARGSCWPNGPNSNRWFRFQATSPDISVMVRTGGIEGSGRRPDLALWDTLKTQLACARWVTDYGDEEVYATGLTVGDWYYISVDNAIGGTPGTFSLCVTDHAVNDFLVDAIPLADLNNWCGEDAQYSNILGTADESQGSCWTGIDNKNVWFKFLATSSKATVKVTTGGDYGQMVNQQVAIWDDLGSEIACAGPFAGQGELTILPTGMTIGDWYYISVDDDNTPGTFTLCVDDTIDYDYPEGAFEITNPVNWCSPDAGFSNASATADSESGSCWDGANFQNVWFTFIAPASTMNIQVKTGTSFGTMRRQQIALFDASLNEVGCAGSSLSLGIRQFQIDTLTAGNRYYIAVDNGEASGGNVGTFTLCTDTTLSYDYQAGAITVPHVYCSADAEFTLVQATEDQGPGSCWGGSALTNVWFKFQATTPYVTVSLKSAGIYGSLQRGQMAIWNANDEEVSCRAAVIRNGTLLMMADTLTVGAWYWIAVDMDENASDDLLGSFSLCLANALGYDKKGGALVIPHNYGCSGDASFSNALATDDGGIGSCWGNSNGNSNVWFKFQATTPYAKLELKTGNVYGTMRRGQMAIFNSANVQVACINDIIQTGTTILITDTLHIGDWYWVSVDDNQTSGTFSLCLDDELDYDYLGGALEIPHNYGCSADARFSNFQATADQIPGSCWGTYNSVKNVWFKFQATSPYATVQVKTGSIYGSMQRAQMAMWDASMNEVVCVGRIVGQGLTEMVIDTLSVGDWYYVSVDDDYVSGSFTFCLTDRLSFDYQAGAKEILHNMGCSADAAYTNYYATADEVPGACWGTYNTTKNVWFKFQATSRFLTFEVKTGSIYGDMQRAQMAVFNSAGVEVGCVGPIVGQGTTTLSADTLNPGDWYYISVDDNYISGMFTVCISDQPTYDYWEGAIELNHDEGCSADGAYTNLAATPDMIPGSCWGNSNTLKNVWFKFQATTSSFTAELKTGSVYGNMQRGQMALWNESFQQVACVGDFLTQGTTSMSIDSLTVGNWYYLSVDDNSVSGTFSLCLSDLATYDFFNGALELPHNGGCSADAEYSNQQATADRSMGTCWTGVNPTDNKNVWFKFQANTSDVTLTLRNYNVYGTMRYPQAALWNSVGAEIKCLPRNLSSGTSTLSFNGLTVGAWYYVSVDDANTSGTFTLCLDDKVDYDYKAGAYEILSPVRWCSEDAEFSNYFGTPDEMRGSCWVPDQNNNVWFKFTAISTNVNIKVKNGTTQGTLVDLQAALWSAGGDELGCATTEVNIADIALSSATLTIGETYYISVDDSQAKGSFTLCVDSDPLHATLVGSNVSCNGADDGVITVTAEGGTGFGYSYSWLRNGVPYVGGSSITGLDPATYKVTLGDLGDPATTVILTYVVTEAPALTLSLSKTDASCPGDADGSVTATRGGGSGLGFTYVWYQNDLPLADVTQTLLNVPSAEYRVVVTDFGAPTCTITDSIVLVNTKAESVAPTGITITNDGSCPGTSKTLSVTGGSLGDAAVWNWYTHPGFASSSGIGASISVDPAISTTYYVRAEGLCNTTSNTFRLVAVRVPSTDPTSINLTNDNECVGVSKTLTVLGGSLGDGATWEWYTDAGFTTSAGSGPSISVDPLVSTTYYVRAEGDCNNTNALSQLVTVRVPSVDPTGIGLTNNNTCFGTSKVLTVLGGSLGDGANWYWYSNAALTMLVGTGSSLTVDPLVSSSFYVRAQGDCNNTNALSQLVTVRIPSTDPTGITIVGDNTCSGSSKTLTVQGGSLGAGADWYWYSDAGFSTLVGTGASISVDPLVSTTYYVRAEGDCNNTNAVSRLVTVLVPSTDPTGINLTNDDECVGVSKVLTVQGGSLGTGATWEWYTDAGFTTSAGSGPSITVNPLVSTTYYVRAEGDCNNTNAVSQLVTVRVPSTDPTGISLTNDNSCFGTSKVLTVLGGSLGDGADWYWYSNAALTTLLGTGGSLTVDPLVSTTYYVRAQGDCNTTNAVNQLVTVRVPSTNPTGITIVGDNTCSGTSKALTVQGGSLGAGANWYWYSDAGFSTLVGTGASITVNPLVSTTYYVRAEGDCNNTNAVSRLVTVLVPSTDPTGINLTNDNECVGVSKVLTVQGGSLGDGATWEWYTNAGFTTSAGSGPSITVNPLVSTTYYVRAEGDCNNTNAVSQLVTVRVPSTDPTGINLTNDDECVGVSKVLTVLGGSLGDGATWEWYTDAGFTTSAGSGPSISVDPLVSTTYYVRAEGDCNNTSAVNQLVTVRVPSTDPTGISLTNNDECVGVSKVLTVQGGSLGDGATWEWYTDAGFTTSAGSGPSITVNPLVSTTYYVRAEGDCNNSNALSRLVTVRVPSTDPTGISLTNDNSCFGTSKVLTVLGGSLGDGADWYWYSNAALTTLLGTGGSLTVDPLVSTTYYVRAQGDCNTTNAVNQLVTVRVASTNPTGITIVGDNTCSGTSKALTVQGGSLGDGANWYWYSDAGFSTLVGTGASITVNPLVSTTYYVRAEGDCNNTNAVSRLVTVLVPSTDPTGINLTNDNECVGVSKVLTVQGGSLGAGATWEWYTDAGFTTSAGTGASISVDPLVSTTYYVRAEGDCNNTNAVNQLVTVRVPSTDPTGINLTNDNECVGVSKVLTVQGGSLGDGATWEWYTDAGFTTSAGSGPSISVDPLVSTTYYVRAEGDCNNTNALSRLVTVRVPSTDPTGITIVGDNTCFGTSKVLTVLGGSLGDGANWYWYSNAALTMLVGTGSSLTVDPLVSSSFYVRAQGDCNNTNALSQLVTVRIPSTDPTGITIVGDNTCSGSSKTLTVQGGSLGAGADWYWYSDAGFSTLVGTGASISVDPLVSTTYYVRAEGDCNNTNAVSQLVTVRVASTDPTGINLTNDDECVGVSKVLTVQGGSLGTGATWEWYTDAGFTTSAGSGPSITVNPLVSTTYYVRAEGDCNNSNALSRLVTVRVPSTDPTGISLTNDNSCFGTSKVLTVLGGSLGDGADWYWYSNAALTTLLGTGGSLTVDPLVSTTYYVRAQGDCNTTNAVNQLVTVRVPSTNPTGITIVGDNTCSGTSKALTVQGGSLGDGANWYWYSDAGFSTLVGTGASITVNPLVSTTYYVRAEGDCNNTNALSRLVTVLVPSTDPTGINLTNDNECVGVSKVLTVQGGSLGAGATWEWYTDAGFTTSAGSGPSITVDPLVSTTYYVRAEGDCNNTNAVSQLVTVRVASTDPTGINLTNDDECVGVSKVLTVQGGSLGAGATWEWYTNAGFSTLVGTGASISVDPLVSTTYYVRAEGDCNNTNAVSRLVTVLVPSTDPTGINLTNDDECVGVSKVLTVQGGSLGTGATWEWYTDAGFTTSAGSGPSITVNPLVSTTYYVRAEGDCNNSNALSRLVTVRVPSTDPTGISLTNDNSCFGTSKVLTVLGGSLGDGADWYWYSNAALTTLLGTGGSLTVDPLVSTTYYVRAQGDCNTTNAVNQLVTVRVASTNPTGITIVGDNTCSGTSKALTVQGGSLGDGANWYWYSDAGFSTLVGTGASITVNPLVSTTYYVRAEGDCNNTNAVSRLVTVLVPSTDPTGINLTNDNECVGVSKVLTVQGGSLGDGATWEWYTNAGFTTSAGSGPSITVNPLVSITYYVRGEGGCNTTTGISQLVTVSTESVDATSITVSNDATCEGTLKTLTVVGGTLGTNATWEWYSDASFTTSAGSGPSTIVDPASTATYYLRAEGDCNTTTGISVVVNVSSPSVDPTIITVLDDNTCAGTEKQLDVVGGTLGANADWEWFSDAGFITSVGSGPSITVDPAITSTYYLRAEGDCNTTNGISVVVNVSSPSLDPTGVTVLNDGACSGTTKTLTVVGGTLGTNSTWEWYSDATFLTSAGSGPSTTVDPAVTATYYVRAEGDCNTTAGISQLVTVSTGSFDPSSVTILNDSSCSGTFKDLTIVGGILGSNATWEWYSDATFLTSAGSGPSITVDPATTASYYVRAEGDCNISSGISAVVSVSTVSVDPTGITVLNDNTCEGTVKQLDVVGGTLGENATWEWYSDAGFTISAGRGPSITIDPAIITSYYVRAEGTCNTSSAVEQLVIVMLPSIEPAEASANVEEFCEGEVDEIILTYSGGFLGDGAVANWYSDSLFTGLVIATGNNVTIGAPTDTTVYYVRFEGDCNITGAVSVQVVVNPMAAPVMTGIFEACVPEELTYIVSGVEGSLFNWSVTGGTISGDTSGESITVMWDGEGTGTVTVTEATISACVASINYNVVKNLSPVASEIESRPGVICRGEQNVAYRINGLPNSVFEWNVEEGIISGDFGDSIHVDWHVPAGTYQLWVVETTENGCPGDTLRLTVQVEGPELDVGEDAHICEGDLFTIDLSGQFTSYLWGDGSTGESYSTSEEGWISLTVGDTYACADSDSIYLSVHAPPVVDLGDDTYLCGDVGMILDPGNDGIYYDWSTGENSQTITVYQGDRQEISVIVENEFGCISIDTIVVDECNLEYYFKDIPTAITPNGDGVNDDWNIEKLLAYTQCEVEIFDRWGTLVWKSEPGYSTRWDGRNMGGNEVPMDSYHFVIKLNVGTKDRVNGIITVIK